LKIGLMPDRDQLYRRLDERCRQMFEGGLVEEVQRILSLGFPASSKPFESHGYKQALQLVNGELTPRDALYYAQRNTRNYAKRQMTWFRKEADMHWFKDFGEEPEIQAAVMSMIRTAMT
jgi:tRNA dimethylallyltransferase